MGGSGSVLSTAPHGSSCSVTEASGSGWKVPPLETMIPSAVSAFRLAIFVYNQITQSESQPGQSLCWDWPSLSGLYRGCKRQRPSNLNLSFNDIRVLQDRVRPLRGPPLRGYAHSHQ